MPWAPLTDSRLYFELVGRGEPLLLIPGLGAACRASDPDIPRLSQHFTLICPELRGSGRSEAHRLPQSLRDYTADLVELLDYLQLDRVHVMGLSLGGIIAQRLAVDHPGRVDRLVLLSCAHRFGPFLREMATLVGHTIRHFPPRLFRRTLELLGTSPLYMDADPLRIDRKIELANGREPSMKAVAQQLRCLVAGDAADDYRIEAPTLVLAGEFDALIPHCYVRQMAEAIPGSRFVLVRGAGHNPLYECPERLLPTITHYLKTGQILPIPPLRASAEARPSQPGAAESAEAA